MRTNGTTKKRNDLLKSYGKPLRELELHSYFSTFLFALKKFIVSLTYEVICKDNTSLCINYFAKGGGEQEGALQLGTYLGKASTGGEA